MKYLQCPKCKIEMRTVAESVDENGLSPTITFPNADGWHKHQDCGVRMRQLTEENYNTEKALNDNGARD